jgi:hypothetical protein
MWPMGKVMVTWGLVAFPPRNRRVWGMQAMTALR